MLKRLQGTTKHACDFLGCGRNDKVNYIAMSLLGPSLSELRKRQPHQHFSISTTLRIGLQVLASIRAIHDCGFLHRDIKPSNFAIGGTQATARICFVLDFGLSRQYTTLTGEVRQARPSAGFRGTVRYASINAHIAKDLGRHDDLWSVFYMLVELAIGHLPWRRIKDKDEAGKSKAQYDHKKLILELPIEFEIFLDHLKGLSYSDKPDYSLIEGALCKAMRKIGVNDSDSFDWEQDFSAPSITTTASGGSPPAIINGCCPEGFNNPRGNLVAAASGEKEGVASKTNVSAVADLSDHVPSVPHRHGNGGRDHVTNLTNEPLPKAENKSHHNSVDEKSRPLQNGVLGRSSHTSTCTSKGTDHKHGQQQQRKEEKNKSNEIIVLNQYLSEEEEEDSSESEPSQADSEHPPPPYTDQPLPQTPPSPYLTSSSSSSSDSSETNSILLEKGGHSMDAAPLMIREGHSAVNQAGGATTGEGNLEGRSGASKGGSGVSIGDISFEEEEEEPVSQLFSSEGSHSGSESTDSHSNVPVFHSNDVDALPVNIKDLPGMESEIVHPDTPINPRQAYDDITSEHNHHEEEEGEGEGEMAVQPLVISSDTHSSLINESDVKSSGTFVIKHIIRQATTAETEQQKQQQSKQQHTNKQQQKEPQQQHQTNQQQQKESTKPVLITNPFEHPLSTTPPPSPSKPVSTLPSAHHPVLTTSSSVTASVAHRRRLLPSLPLHSTLPSSRPHTITTSRPPPPPRDDRSRAGLRLNLTMEDGKTEVQMRGLLPPTFHQHIVNRKTQSPVPSKEQPNYSPSGVRHTLRTGTTQNTGHMHSNQVGDVRPHPPEAPPPGNHTCVSARRKRFLKARI